MRCSAVVVHLSAPDHDRALNFNAGNDFNALRYLLTSGSDVHTSCT